MKHLSALFIFTIISSSAFAQPGSNTLVCKSAANSGSKQKLEFYLFRSNGIGWFAPKIEVKIDDHKVQLKTPNEKSNYGLTFHNSPLKVVTVTADVPFKEKQNTGFFSVVAIPETVKAFDRENHPVKWTWELEKEECSDANGKAKFQGIIHGQLYLDNSERPEIDAQIMDCELSYNSGMAC
jgi:hypothetical protein